MHWNIFPLPYISNVITYNTVTSLVSRPPEGYGDDDWDVQVQGDPSSNVSPEVRPDPYGASASAEGICNGFFFIFSVQFIWITSYTPKKSSTLNVISSLFSDLPIFAALHPEHMDADEYVEATGKGGKELLIFNKHLTDPADKCRN